MVLFAPILLLLPTLLLIRKTHAFQLEANSRSPNDAGIVTKSMLSDSPVVMYALSRDAMNVPLWPYVGCSGNCGGGAVGLFLALASCGVGFPLSEDVLLIGLAPRLLATGGDVGMVPLVSKVSLVVAAVTGVAAADTLTVCVGRALRINADALSRQAPGFLRRMLRAVGRQLAAESRRDGARLREQIETRLRAASVDLGDQLRRVVAYDSGSNRGDEGDKSSSGRRVLSIWRRLEMSNTWFRRVTCNTRTSLAAWGQTSASLARTVTSRINYQPARHKSSTRRSDGEEAGKGEESLLAGVDNRLAVGQRWPLALLSGFSADPALEYRPYFAGAAIAAATVTLPVQILLGAALQDWARVLCYVGIAGAQLCRYGPIWATVFVAIADTVRTEIEAAKRIRNKTQ